jgi:hypothetical protein
MPSAQFLAAEVHLATATVRRVTRRLAIPPTRPEKKPVGQGLAIDDHAYAAARNPRCDMTSSGRSFTRRRSQVLYCPFGPICITLSRCAWAHSSVTVK